MDIVIIGTGNVATILGRKFIAAGHTILQVFGRHAMAASELAYEWNTESANYWTVLNQQADVYIIAVADAAISEIAEHLLLPGKVVAHTAASVDMHALKKITSHYGVFYPLQSLRKEAPYLPSIPIYYEGIDKLAKEKLGMLAATISSNGRVSATTDERIKLHIGAVLVNNFVNHLYVLADEYCKKEGIDFLQLMPLIEETVLRLRTMTPKLAQTGPALRFDTATIARHLELLAKHPHLKEVYLTLSHSIQGMK